MQGTIYNKLKTYYLFNHVDLEITYHSGAEEDWGAETKEQSGRIICKQIFIQSQSVIQGLLIY